MQHAARETLQVCCPFHVMPTRARNVAIWGLAVAGGLLLGYALANPLPFLESELAISVAKPLLQVGSECFVTERGRSVFLLATGGFLMALPNTLLVTIAAALCLRKIQCRRPFLYATLVWPAVFWLSVLLLNIGAAIRGASIEADTYLFAMPIHMRDTAVLLFLNYSVFFSLVWLLDRSFNKPRHYPSINTDAAR
jgi:hypothetical protein